MLLVIPDTYMKELVVETVPNDYAKKRKCEIEKVIIAYYSMLEYSASSQSDNGGYKKPPFVDSAANNTITLALSIINNRTRKHIEKVYRENQYRINNICQAIIINENMFNDEVMLG